MESTAPRLNVVESNQTTHGSAANGSKPAAAFLKTRETDTAVYIADMILELRNLAHAGGHKTLTELLEISYYEAFNRANRIEAPAGEDEFIHALGADARKAANAGR